MFRPLSLYIGLRYTCAKRRNRFISFIALASMLGIALGVTVLITVLSVMNGFDYEIHNRIFNMVEHVKINSIDNNSLNNWQDITQKISHDNKVLSSAPFVTGQGMISNTGRASGVLINGVLPELENNVSELNKFMLQGSLNKLKPNEFGILLGQELASQLGIHIGDQVTLITPQATATPIGVLPRFKRFTVEGIFHVGGGFGYYDSGMVFIHINDAQKMFQLGSNVSGIKIKTKNLYDAPIVSHQLQNILSYDYFVSDWTQEYGAYFKAIKMEKTTMFVVLLFIVAVAVFNLVSSLVMTVNDKKSAIAILRTLGASPQNIMNIFIIQGGIIGFIGTILGISGGVLLALNAPRLVTLLEDILHTHLISGSIYFVNYLPSRLIWSDVWHIGLITFIMSLLATIYPSWKASKTQPAEALRYE